MPEGNSKVDWIPAPRLLWNRSINQRYVKISAMYYLHSSADEQARKGHSAHS